MTGLAPRVARKLTEFVLVICVTHGLAVSKVRLEPGAGVSRDCRGRIAFRGSASARDDQPTLGRQVDALEEELGLVLFERAGRGLSLTPAGSSSWTRFGGWGRRRARFRSPPPARRRRSREYPITASEIEAVTLLPPIIARLRREAPGIEVEILADLGRRPSYAAIPTSPSVASAREPELIAKRIRDDAARLYATPAYLDQRRQSTGGRGTRRGPTFIGFDETDRYLDGLNAQRPRPDAGEHQGHQQQPPGALGAGQGRRRHRHRSRQRSAMPIPTWCAPSMTCSDR